MSSEPPPSLAARLSRSRVGLNPDLQVSRHVLRGVPAYVVRNALTLQSHLLSAADYRLLTRIRSERTLGQTFDELVADGLLESGGEEAFYHFVLGLHRQGFLQLPIPDEQQLYRRHVSGQRARRWQRVTSVFFLRVPLFNPDALLERTAVIGRVVFSRGFFALWAVLVGLAAYLAVRNAGDFTAPLQQLGSAADLPSLFGVLLGLKLFHEFGHAYACKRFGGQVPEMGAYLIVFTPCAYVDTTSAWSFARKRERVFVCLAGMYVELFFAALGMIVWSATTPSALSQVAFHVALLGSVVTVGLNVNPLMRFDGYYALSDLLEIPNLRARAQAELGRTFKRVCLGLRTSSVGASRRLRAFLVAFGVAGGLYKVSIVLVLSAVIARKYPAVGLLLAAVYVGMEIARLLRRAVRTFFLDRETAGVRARAACVGVFLLALLPVGLCILPVPHGVVAPAVLSAEQVELLRAEREGFLGEIRAQAADHVVPGQALVLLEDPRAEESVRRTRTALERAVIELRVARASEVPRVAELEERVRQLQGELATRQLERDRLTVRSPSTGALVALVSRDESGRFVGAGEPLATVASGGYVARAMLTEEQVERARPAVGGRVEFRSKSDPSRTLRGSITRIAELDADLVDQTAVHLPGAGPTAGARAEQVRFEVTVRLDPAPDLRLLHGGTGSVRLQSTLVPVARIALRGLLNFRNRLSNQG